MSEKSTHVLLLTRYDNRKAWVDHLRDVCGFAVDHMALDDVEPTKLNELVSDGPIVLVDDSALTAATKTMLKQINSARPHCQVILCTALENVTETVLAELDDCHYLTEPISVELVGVSIRRAAKIHRMEREQFRAERITRPETGQNYKLQVIKRLGDQMNSAFDLQELLRVALIESLKAIGTSSGSIMLIDPTENVLKMKTWIEDGEFVVDKPYVELKIGEGIAGHVAQTGQIYNCVDASQDPNCKKIANGFNAGSILCVPIISHGSVLGTINADHPETHFFSPDDLHFWAVLAGQVALAIETRLLRDAFDDEDLQTLQFIAEESAGAIKSARLLEQTERRARLLNAAANVSRDATSILDEQELLDRVVQLIVEHFDLLYHAGVFLIEKKWAVLKAASSAGGREMIRQNHRLEIGTQGIVGWVAKHAQPRLTSDVRKDTYHYQNPFLSETRAEMAFPLKAYGQLIGVLDVQSKEVMYLEDEDIATLQTMADQLANAINNARLYKESDERL
ncbi:MAG: GAF domain-containing protein, partial [Anaerolineae bacterium]|nr:GAF domain-containing protein [Anaerolineae bacterium]